MSFAMSMTVLDSQHYIHPLSSQNKKGRKNFQLHCFLNTFSQLPAVKKYSKNGAAGNFFDPSYSVTALEQFFLTVGQNNFGKQIPLFTISIQEFGKNST